MDASEPPNPPEPPHTGHLFCYCARLQPPRPRSTARDWMLPALRL